MPVRVRWRELLLVVLVLTVLVLLALPRIQYVIHETDRLNCQENLRRWSVVFSMYSHEDPGNAFPPIAHTARTGITPADDEMPFHATPFGAAVYPEYMSELDKHICPGSRYERAMLDGPDGLWRDPDTGEQDPARLVSPDYIYLGYLLTESGHAATLFAALLEGAGEQGDADIVLAGALAPEELPAIADEQLGPAFAERDVPLPQLGSPIAAERLLRLQRGAYRWLGDPLAGELPGEEAAAEVPVMWDRCAMDPTGRISAYHLGEGFWPGPAGHVLYMDGSVAPMEYGAGFPMDPASAVLHDLLPGG